MTVCPRPMCPLYDTSLDTAPGWFIPWLKSTMVDVSHGRKTALWLIADMSRLSGRIAGRIFIKLGHWTTGEVFHKHPPRMAQSYLSQIMSTSSCISLSVKASQKLFKSAFSCWFWTLLKISLKNRGTQWDKCPAYWDAWYWDKWSKEHFNHDTFHSRDLSLKGRTQGDATSINNWSGHTDRGRIDIAPHLSFL
jgi:hypothetical protein